MHFDNFRVLNLRRLRERKLRTGASIIGIASGVGLVVAMLSLLTSVQATATSTVELLGGAQAEISAAKPLSNRQLTAIRNLDDVEAVARFVQTPVLINGTFGWLVALDEDPLLGTRSSRALAGVKGIVVGQAFAPSKALKITAPDGLTIEANAARRVPSSLRNLYAGKFIAADVATALRLQPKGGSPVPVSLLIFGKGKQLPDLAKIQRILGTSGRVELTSLRITRAQKVFEVLFSSLSILGTMGLVVGGFLLFNTMNMAVLDRRQEIAAMRALGGSRRTIWTGLLGEALLLGAVGSALGLLLGKGLASGVVSSAPDAFARTIGTPLRSSVPATLLAPVWLLGILTALIAAIGPIRRTLNIQPIEALRPEEVSVADSGVTIHPVPILIATVWLVIATFTRMIPSVLAVGTALIPLMLLAYGLAQPISWFVGELAKRMGNSGELAALSLQRAPRRVWATTMTVIVSIAIAVGATATVINLQSSNKTDLAVNQLSDFWLGTTSGDNIGLTAMPLDWESKLKAIPGVRAVAGSRWTARSVSDHSVGVLGIRGDSSYGYYRLASDPARHSVLSGEGVVVNSQYLKAFGARVGDVIDLPGANPPIRLPIVGSSSGITATDGGIVSVSSTLLSKHYGINGMSFYEAQLTPGADRRAVRAALESLATTSPFPIHIHTGAEFAAAATKAGDQVLSLIGMVLLVITICAGIAMLNTLLASVLDRTREVAVLRAIGATQTQLVRSVLVESLAIGLTGSLLGALAGTLLHRIMIDRIAQMTSFHIVGAFAPITLVMAVVAGVGISLVGGTIPSRRVARLNLLQSLSH
jgi:putative ABC transport system permease protein